MKWIARRILLKSTDRGLIDRIFIETALTELVDPFVEKIKQEEGITDWYCSRKTEDDRTRPSVRVYLCIDESRESQILCKLDQALKEKQSLIGWTGRCDVESPPDPLKPNLKLIQEGCESALRLMRAHPDINRHKDPQFLATLKTEVDSLLDSMESEYDWEPIHFVANNLGLTDDLVRTLTSYNYLR